MKRRKEHAHACAPVEMSRLLAELDSPEEAIRARATRQLCPCRSGWELFEGHLELARKMCKDPSPLVRAQALHLFEDAAEMMTEGLPTTPQANTNDMVRKKRESRFRREEDELATLQQERKKPSHRARPKAHALGGR